MAKVGAVLVSILVVVGLGVAAILGAFDGASSTTFPRQAKYVPASNYTPSIPQSATLGEPYRGIDPGFSGWTGNVFGYVRRCPSGKEKRIAVALMQGSHLVAGEVVNKSGGFTFSFEWPDKAVNGGGPTTYTLVSNTGASEQLVLRVSDTTYAILSGDCSV